MSEFRMIDVGDKTPTKRRAVACGRIRMAPETATRIAAKEMPKGDVLALAEVAGIQGAKRVSETLPLCHPLGLDSVWVTCAVVGSEVVVSCEARAFAKTGVEMEALAGVSAALLSVYDLTKGVDPALTISEIHLEIKEGGKSGLWVHPHHKPQLRSEGDIEPTLKGCRTGVLTVSDRCFRGEAKDSSGPAAVEFLKVRGATDVAQKIVADEKTAIQDVIKSWGTEGLSVVVVTGGTGLAPRDVTPEAVESLWTKRIPGFSERVRLYGSRFTERSWLSRCEAGLVDRTLVLLLPGSPKAVLESLEALDELIPHALHIVRGGSH
ncbi:bifunctional molybdenum cofactor biosynthesis protein MoaC/MoaB [Bdellovibrionota bacterium FG-2]